MKLCKKLISLLIALCMITTIIPTAAFAVQIGELASVASYVYINGVKLTNGDYWRNGDTIRATGTASSYNAHFENGVLYLNNAKITQKDE